MPWLILVAAETNVCMSLSSKLISASAIPASKLCLPSRCLAMDYFITIHSKFNAVNIILGIFTSIVIIILFVFIIMKPKIWPPIFF
jgi:hypothetical protein